MSEPTGSLVGNWETRRQIIMHVDMDAFFASSELRRHPEYKGLPVIIGTGTRSVVSAASYEARKYGVYSAQPVYIAKQKCPQGIFLPVDMDYYAEISAKVFEIFYDFSPFVEHLSIDEAFIDITGARKIFGSPKAIADQIRQRISSELGITCSVGIAENKSVAKLASDQNKPNGVCIVEPEDTQDFLNSLPVKSLWGVGKKTQEMLSRYAVKTVADFIALGEPLVLKLLGQTGGAKLWAMANGHDPREVITEHEPKSLSADITLPNPTSSIEIMEDVLANLADKVARRLLEAKLEASHISVTIKASDFTMTSASSSLPNFTASRYRILTSAKELLAKLGGRVSEDILSDSSAEVQTKFPYPVRLLSISVSKLRDGTPNP